MKLLLKDDTAHELSVKEGGRVVSLPASEGTIRGFSSVDLVVEDESARVNDELHTAVKPMVAVSKGRLILMSTPFKMKGHYYDIWNDTTTFTDYKRIEVPATKIERISPEFLEQEKRAMGSRVFSREYMCQFINEADTPMFYREWFEIVPSFPRGGKTVRCWDLAATAPKPGKDPDYTVGAKVTKLNGIYYISDIRRTRATPGQVEDLIKQTALLDELPVRIRMEQEPGSSGVNTIDHYARKVLDGFVFKGVPSSGDKSMRAAPFASAAEAGNVKIVGNGYDVRALLDELANFPQGDHDDQVDAISGAFEELNRGDPNRFLIMHTGKERY
jgi:predicted phage terminase large subunit-like protein